MSKTKNLILNRTDELNLFIEMWENTWQKLADNPYWKFAESLDLDWVNGIEIFKAKVCLSLSDCEQELLPNPKGENIAELTSDKEEAFAYQGCAEFIDSYLKKHNIQLVDTGRNEWTIIRFMAFLLGDFNNAKVMLWHNRYDDESGEFAIFDRSFVDQCLKDGKLPDILGFEEAEKAIALFNKAKAKKKAKSA